MRTSTRISVAAAAALTAAAAAAATSAPVQATTSRVHRTPPTNTSTILAQAPIPPLRLFGRNVMINGKPWAAMMATLGQTDGYVVENDFEPGQTTGWHSHPGPSLIFVVSGTVTNYTNMQPGCAGVSYSAGSTFVDQGGTSMVHQIVDTGSTNAELIAVQFIPQGQPRRIDQPPPTSCTS